jgi:hydroxyacylglutathione hydrolase
MIKKIQIYPLPSLQDNYIWALCDLEHKKVSVVDPGEAEPVLTFLKQEQFTLQSILITHHHWDHTQGIPALKTQGEVPVYGPRELPHVTQALAEGSRLSQENSPLALEVFAIPGHTLDHLAYYAPGVLFCGDTLFAAGCGRLFEGSALELYSSLQRIAALPADTKIYCAHEYTLNNLRFAAVVEPGNPAILKRLAKVKTLRENQLVSLPTTLREEKETNPFLRCDQPLVKAATEKFSGQILTTPLEVFSSLRKWKDGFK